MARNVWELRSIGFARQADLYTENTTDGDFLYMFAEMDSPPEHEREIEDFTPSVPQVGAYAAPIPGSRHGGTLTMRFPWEAMKSTYDATADVLGTTDLTIGASHLLLGNALGSGGASLVASAADFRKGKHLQNDPYGANNVVGVPTTSKITVTDATKITTGAAVAAMSAGDGVESCVGWSKNSDAAAGPPQEINLFEAAAYAAVATDETYGGSTAWLSDAARVPLTLRVLGSKVGLKIAYVGLICTGFKFAGLSGKTPMLETTWIFTDRKEYATGGGLQALSQKFHRVPPILGDNGGRLTIDGAVVHGVKDLEIAVEWEPIAIPSHSVGEGVSEIVLGPPQVSVNCKVAEDDGEAVTDFENVWETRLTNATVVTLQLVSGKVPGKIGTALMPALHVAGKVSKVVEDGATYYSFTLRPDTYSGDTGSTAPADSLVRFAVL